MTASRSDLVLSAEGLVKHYRITQGIVIKKRVGTVQAVDGIDLTLRRGETLALVGESGCGKSTTSRLLLGLEAPTAGSVWVDGDDLAELSPKSLRTKRRNIQLILQDPYTSLNPRMTVKAIIGEPFEIHSDALPPNKSKLAAVQDLMAMVGLDPSVINRYPHEFSGGQRQRIGIARALALRPKIIVADEPVSALDVSIQAQVINLLMDLRDDLNLSYVVVSHDLAVVRQIADRVAVMYLGKVVETGPEAQIYRSPAHPYTQALLAAVPVPNPLVQPSRDRIEIAGDSPSPTDLPSGCRYRTRCWQAQQLCGQEEPPLVLLAPEHEVACHFPIVGQSGPAGGKGSGAMKARGR